MDGWPMTPEDRAKSVLHFLDEYIKAEREYTYALAAFGYASPAKVEKARQFLGTALVALVTDGRKVDE